MKEVLNLAAKENVVENGDGKKAMDFLISKYEILLNKIRELQARPEKKKREIALAVRLTGVAEEIMDLLEDMKQAGGLDQVKFHKVLLLLSQEQIAVRDVYGFTPEGRFIIFDLAERMKYWNAFYVKHGVDWVETLPDGQRYDFPMRDVLWMRLMIKEFGFDNMVFIPNELLTGSEGVVKEKNKPDSHLLYLLETLGSKQKKVKSSIESRADLPVGRSKEKRTGIRVIMTKDAAEIKEDETMKQTVGKRVEQLKDGEIGDGPLTWKKLDGFSVKEYLIIQKDFFERTGIQMDAQAGTSIFLPGSQYAATEDILGAYWNERDQAVEFFRVDKEQDWGDNMGSRLGAIFNISFI